MGWMMTPARVVTSGRVAATTVAAVFHSGPSGARSVFSSAIMWDGNMELHRNVIHNTLFTDVNVGRGSYAMCTGGPRTKGASAGAHTTYWNIYGDSPIM